MGRKALEKERKPLSTKVERWLRELFPKLQDKELDKLTLDELALLMNKSKSTLYTYFTTKEEIYQTSVRLVLNDLESAIYEELPTGTSMEEVYGVTLHKISQGIQGISIHFFHQIQAHFPEIWLMIEAFIERLLQSFRTIYEQGMTTGEFKRFNTDLLMAMDNHFVLSIMTDATRFEQYGLTLNDLVTEYLELRIRALRVP